MKTVKDLVKDNKKVFFRFYRNSELWYITEDGFEFPVPTSDVGDACFLAEDRAILFMRYIRKHLDMLNGAKVEQNSTPITAANVPTSEIMVKEAKRKEKYNDLVRQYKESDDPDIKRQLRTQIEYMDAGGQ